MIEEAGSSSSSSEDCSPSKKPKTESFVEIKDLVTFMTEDPFLIDNWSKFSDFLGLQTQNKARWTRGINNLNLNYHEVFSEMLRSWVSSTNLKKRTVRELCGVLRKIKCVSVAETLEENFLEEKIINLPPGTERKSEFIRSPASKEIKWPITHGLLVPASNFSGREKELTELNSTLNSDKTNLILICGFGGIGKTELCKKFGNEITRSNTNITISRIWLHGESIGTLWDSILEIAMELGVTNEGNPSPSEYFKYMASMILEKCDRLWVVIDNVDVIYEEVTEIIKTVQLAKISGKLFVIVTSRDKNILEGAGITLQLDVLSKEEARIMLQNSMINLTNPEADKLSNLLQYLPLALQQAVAYIKQQRKHIRTKKYSVSNYVDEFEVKKSQMLDQKLNKFEHEYSMTTLLTWNITIGKLTEGAVEILKVIAHLNPDRIRVNFLEGICTRMHFKDFYDSLDLIYNYSLVKIEDEIISIHRLVQEVLRGKVENPEDYCKPLFDKVLIAFWKNIQFGESHLSRIYKFAWKREFKLSDDFQLVLLFLLEHDRLDCATEYVKLRFPHIYFNSDLTEKEFKEFLEKVILWSIVNINVKVTNEMIETGAYMFDPESHLPNAEQLEIGLRIAEKYFGDKSQLTCAVKSRLIRRCAVKTFGGTFEKAIILCEELVGFPFEDEKQQKYCFKNIYYILGVIENDIKRDLNQNEASLQLGRIDKIITYYCKTYPDNWECIELQAKLLDLQGHYEKSFELYTKLVSNFEQTGDVKNIEKCKLKLIELKIKLTDFDNTTKEEIQRDFGAADYENFPLQELLRILPIYEKILGPHDPLTVKVLLELIGCTPCCTNDGKLRSIKLCEKILNSPFDQKYKWAFDVICIIRKIQSNYKEQKKILEPLLEGFKMKGENHSGMLRVKSLLARTMESSGELQEALKLFEQVRDLAIKCEWDELDLIESRLNVARVKLRIGDLGIIKTRHELLKEFGEFGNYRQDLTLEELKRILPFYKSILGENDKLSLRVSSEIAWKLIGINNIESLALLDQVIISGGDEDEIKTAYDMIQGIGIDYCYQEDNEKSKELLERVLKFRIQSVGEKHESTIKTEEYFAWMVEKLSIL